MGTTKIDRRKLALRLQEDIYERELAAGERVGSIRRLAMRYHVSPLTISRLFADMTEAGVLYRDEKGFFCVKNQPLRKPHIGYAGTPLTPDGSFRDCLSASATNSLFNTLEKLNSQPRIIGYHELCIPELARERLKGINGLLLQNSFIDEKTTDILQNSNIHIVRIGQAFSQDNELNCSEVVQHFDPAFDEFVRYCDLKSYRKIINLYSQHSNALALARKVEKFLQQQNLKSVAENMRLKALSSNQAEVETFSFFMDLPPRDWSNTLIISGSGYFSRGIYRAFRQQQIDMPDILSIDNLDDYEKSPLFDEPYITAIDRNMDKIYRDAAQLLYDQVRNSDERKVIIKVPAKLVIRKSITHVRKDYQG